MRNSGRLLNCVLLVSGILVSCAQPMLQPENKRADHLAPEPSSPGAATVPPSESATPDKNVVAIVAPPEPSATVPAASVAQPERRNGLAFGGQLFMAIQNWSNAGMSGDSKLGVGIGGTLGIGFRIDDMAVILGPSIWSNSWSQSYAEKSQSITDRVYVTMNDAGLALTANFDDMFIVLGTGNSTIRSGMVVGGKEIAYGYDGTSYSYKEVGIGFRTGAVLFGLGFKSYDGFAKAANHGNIMLGIGF